MKSGFSLSLFFMLTQYAQAEMTISDTFYSSCVSVEQINLHSSFWYICNNIKLEYLCFNVIITNDRMLLMLVLSDIKPPFPFAFTPLLIYV